MLVDVLYVLVAIAGVSFTIAVIREEPGVFPAISLITWAILGFQADTITLITQSGTRITESAPTLQYVAIGLAIVSAIGVIDTLNTLREP